MAYYASRYDSGANNVLPSGQAGVALVVGEVVYMDSSGYWQKADQVAVGATTRKDALGVMIEDALQYERTSPVKCADIRGFSGLTIGAKQFLSDTEGEITPTEPTTNIRQVVGFAKSATEIFVDIGGTAGGILDIGGDEYSDTVNAVTDMTFGGSIIGTTTEADAVAVGPAGTTNPSLMVACDTSSAATGLKITSAAAAGGLAVAVISSGTNESLTLDAKGSGTITLNTTGTGNVVTKRATVVDIDSATALSVGANGATNPVLLVDAGTGSQATGIEITGAAAAGHVAIAAISSGSDEQLNIDAKGSDGIVLQGTATGGITLTTAVVCSSTLGAGITTITAANASALAVGANGAANPVLLVDSATGSVATGVEITGAAAAGGVAVTVISSGTNEDLTLDAKGSGTISLNATGTGTITMGADVTMADAKNILTDASTGTYIAAVDDKLAFWAATPVVQQAHIDDPAASSAVTFTHSWNGSTDPSAGEGAALITDLGALKTAIDANNTAIDSINGLLATLGLTAAS